MKHPNQTPSNQAPRRSRLRGLVVGTCTALAAVFSLLSAPTTANAQGTVVDNFDSYANTNAMAANGWVFVEAGTFLGFPVSVGGATLVPVGSGQGLNLYGGSDWYSYGLNANFLAYKTNDYTDFYEAVDLIDWKGDSLDQAAVLFARMNDAVSGNVENPQNPGQAQGVIMNYDAAQYNQHTGDRRQGQIQINDITAPFIATTLAGAECTFVIGHSYRLVFTGVGTNLIGKVYDLADLTAPLVTIQGADTNYWAVHGACGLIAFSRNTDGPEDYCDVTFDNYVSAPSDPNLATYPAINHPIPGTPVVIARSPSARWKNFLNIPTDGISFDAATFSANVINASATKLRLNGVDVSAGLTLSANGTNITGSYPGSALDNNQLYSAQIEVTDVAGTKSSTNTFWFDTFSDTFLQSSAVKTIEVEEYNYGTNNAIAEPIPPSGTNSTGNVNAFPTGYLNAVGAAEYDFHSGHGVDSFSMLRPADPVSTCIGGLSGQDDYAYFPQETNPNGTQPGSDNVRSQYSALNLLENTVTYFYDGDWLDYTRSFSNGFYRAYLRYSSIGATTNELDLVADASVTNQVLTKLGTFKVSNNTLYTDYSYTPLVTDTGSPVLLPMAAGSKTLRLTQLSTVAGQDRNKLMANYMMFVQTPITVLSSSTVNGTYNTTVGSVTPDYVNGTLSFPVPAGTTFYRLGAAIPVNIASITVSGGQVILKLAL